MSDPKVKEKGKIGFKDHLRIYDFELAKGKVNPIYWGFSFQPLAFTYVP